MRCLRVCFFAVVYGEIFCLRCFLGGCGWSFGSVVLGWVWCVLCCLCVLCGCLIFFCDILELLVSVGVGYEVVGVWAGSVLWGGGSLIVPLFFGCGRFGWLRLVGV